MIPMPRIFPLILGTRPYISPFITPSFYEAHKLKRFVQGSIEHQNLVHVLVVVFRSGHASSLIFYYFLSQYGHMQFSRTDAQ